MGVSSYEPPDVPDPAPGVPDPAPGVPDPAPDVPDPAPDVPDPAPGVLLGASDLCSEGCSYRVSSGAPTFFRRKSS